MYCAMKAVSSDAARLVISLTSPSIVPAFGDGLHPAMDAPVHAIRISVFSVLFIFPDRTLRLSLSAKRDRLLALVGVACLVPLLRRRGPFAKFNVTLAEAGRHLFS